MSNIHKIDQEAILKLYHLSVSLTRWLKITTDESINFIWLELYRVTLIQL